MKQKPFLFGAILCLLTLGVDLLMLFNGLSTLGIFSVMGTVLVFAAGFVWLVYQNDGDLHFQRPLLIIPLIIFGVAMATAFQMIPVEFQLTPENLAEVGNLVMSRFQIALWIVSVVIFFMFVVATSLMTRRRS